MEGFEKKLLQKLEHMREFYEDASNPKSYLRLHKTEEDYRSPGDERPISNSEKIILTWNQINVVSLKGAPSTCISWLVQLCKIAKLEQKQILKDVNGIARPGELLAILGSHGAGKTILLKTLTCKLSSQLSVTGLICLNGVPLTTSSFRNKMAYVQKELFFIGTLTIKEHLIFQALVRMDTHLTYSQKLERVEEVIDEFILREYQNNLIGYPGVLKSLSCGHLKRLSMASEMLTNPSLIFCDEPTTGLDLPMALNIVHLLKKFAKSGKTVVCSIERPSTELYNICDKVLLMADGQVAFSGTQQEADQFFNSFGTPRPLNYNPAEYYIKILNGMPEEDRTSELICDNFQRSQNGRKIARESATVIKPKYKLTNYVFGLGKGGNFYKTPCCTQFRAVIWRSYTSTIKHPILIKRQTLELILRTLLIGLIYCSLNDRRIMNINGGIFIMLINVCMINIWGVILGFGMNLPVILNENRNGLYSTGVFYLSQTIVDLPYFLVSSVLSTLVSYYLIGLNLEQPRLYIAIGIVLLLGGLDMGVGYFIASAAKDVTMALTIVPFILFLLIVFSGFVLNLSSVPNYLKWLSYITWYRYGNEALLINQWSHFDGINNCTGAVSDCGVSGQMILDSIGFSELNFFADIFILLVILIGFKILTYLALLCRTCCNY